MGTSTGRLPDPVAGCLWDQMIELSRDACETSVKSVGQSSFNSTITHIELTLTS